MSTDQSTFFELRPTSIVAPEQRQKSIFSPSVVTSGPLGATAPKPDFHLDKRPALDPSTCPNRGYNGQPKSTIVSFNWLLQGYEIYVAYDIIRKRLLINIPGTCMRPDNFDNVALAEVSSLVILNGMSTALVPSYLEALGDRNSYNPVAEWINSIPWDGLDRLEAFYGTITTSEEYPGPLKRALMYRWLLSAVAAALKLSGFYGRGVLTLQGPQSIGKTSWVRSLISDKTLQETVLKLDHHLDALNKDSLLSAISHWIVEIGELDSSFKKDVARLKGFLTGCTDKVRRPYARSDSEYPRRTVFCATVNDAQFLVDLTGNTRWWTLPVVKVNYAHGIDMQQLFAQLAVDFAKGEQWWLTPEEERLLEAQNNQHLAVSVIRERVDAYFDQLEPDGTKTENLTAREFLVQRLNIEEPRNPDCKECAAALRIRLGSSKRSKGYDRWPVPCSKADSRQYGLNR